MSLETGALIFICFRLAPNCIENGYYPPLKPDAYCHLAIVACHRGAGEIKLEKEIIGLPESQDQVAKLGSRVRKNGK